MAMGKLLYLPEMTWQVPEGQEMDRRISTQWPERGSRSEELLWVVHAGKMHNKGRVSKDIGQHTTNGPILISYLKNDG